MDKKFRGKLLRLALPIAFQQFLLALVSACDAVMLGGLNQDSLSAVSLASQITFVYNLILTALLIGENMFVAQYYGKRDFQGVRTSTGLVMRYVMITAFCFMLATLIMPGQLMRLFTGDKVLIAYGSRYLRYVGVSYVFSGILQVLQGIMKNCGHVGRSTLLSVMVVGINVVLNALLIYGLAEFPKMEIAGAALATVLANGIGLGVAFGMLVQERELRIRMSDMLCRNREIIKKFWKHVCPVLFNELAWGVGFTMYSIILGHMGGDAVAANSIANITKNILICICSGFGYAGSIVVGNLLGDGRFKEAKKSGNVLCRISIIAGVITGACILVLIPVILHFANLTDTAHGYLGWMLAMSSYYVIGKSINSMIVAGIFPAGGDTRFGLRCDVITMWCFAVPLGFVAAFVLKLPVLAVYFTLNLDEIVKLPAVFSHYKKYKWINNLTEKEN